MIEGLSEFVNSLVVLSWLAGFRQEPAYIKEAVGGGFARRMS
jgi:hypothetical protein